MRNANVREFLLIAVIAFLSVMQWSCEAFIPLQTARIITEFSSSMGKILGDCLFLFLLILGVIFFSITKFSLSSWVNINREWELKQSFSQDYLNNMTSTSPVAMEELGTLLEYDFPAIAHYRARCASTVGTIFSIGIIGGSMWRISPLLAAGVFVCVCFSSWIAKYTQHNVTVQSRHYRQALQEYNRSVMDLTTGFTTIKSAKFEKPMSHHSSNQSAHVYAQAILLGKKEARARALSTLLISVVFLSFICIGVEALTTRSISLHAFLAAYISLTFLQEALQILFAFPQTVLDYRACLKHQNEIQSLVNSVSQQIDYSSLSELSQHLAQIRGVCGLVIDSQLYAESDIYAELIAFCHENDGYFSPQESFIFAGTVAAYLDPKNQHKPGKIMEALGVTCSLPIIDALHEGLDTLISSGGDEFSGGEQQRLTLAQAILTEKPLIFLTEPTSALDAVTQKLVLERIANHRAGQRTVIITRHMRLLQHLDQVIFLSETSQVATHEYFYEHSCAYRHTLGGRLLSYAQ